MSKYQVLPVEKSQADKYMTILNELPYHWHHAPLRRMEIHHKIAFDIGLFYPLTTNKKYTHKSATDSDNFEHKNPKTLYSSSSNVYYNVDHNVIYYYAKNGLNIYDHNTYVNDHKFFERMTYLDIPLEYSRYIRTVQKSHLYAKLTDGCKVTHHGYKHRKCIDKESAQYTVIRSRELNKKIIIHYAKSQIEIYSRTDIDTTIKYTDTYLFSYNGTVESMVVSRLKMPSTIRLLRTKNYDNISFSWGNDINNYNDKYFELYLSLITGPNGCSTKTIDITTAISYQEWSDEIIAHNNDMIFAVSTNKLISAEFLGFCNIDNKIIKIDAIDSNHFMFSCDVIKFNGKYDTGKFILIVNADFDKYAYVRLIKKNGVTYAYHDYRVDSSVMTLNTNDKNFLKQITSRLC